MVKSQEKTNEKHEEVTSTDAKCGCYDSYHGKYGHKHKAHGGSGNAIYALGMVGSIIYYVSTAASFGLGVLGVLKSLVWPAFLVYEFLKYLHM